MEWTAALADRGRDERSPLLRLRIEEVAPPRLLKPLLFCDLFGLDERQAAEVLLSAVATATPGLREMPRYPRPGDGPETMAGRSLDQPGNR